MLVLNEQAKQTGNIIFARTTAVKNIRASNRIKLTASNIKFLSLGFVEISECVEIFEMADILNIEGEPTFIASSS